MKSKNKLLFYISLTILIIIIGVIIAFVYYHMNSKTKKVEPEKVASLEVSYKDNDKMITGTNFIPGWSDTKTFTVKNTGDNVVYYKLKMVDIKNNIDKKGVSFEITSDNGGANIAKRYLLDKDGLISGSIKLEKGKTHNYTIKTYYNLMSNEPNSKEAFSYSIDVENATNN